MKVNFDLNKQIKQTSFQGYKVTKDDKGVRSGEFSYPFDPQTTDCYLEVALVDRDKDGNFYLTGDKCQALSDSSSNGIKLHAGKNKINIHSEFGIMEDEPFAYHYKLVDKSSGRATKYAVDAGSLIDNRANKSKDTDENFYNIYVPASNVSKGGSMLLAVPDTLAPQWVYDADNDIIRNENYDEQKKNIRLFSNKIGGSLAGLEKKLDNNELSQYDKIVSLPLFTDDSRSHHAYWNKNCMQMALSLGNINNYTSVTKKLFAQGKNLVSDGAFVNEGLEGIHLHHALKWKEGSPFFNWFRMNPNNQVLFGVFSQNTDFLSHRVVNPKYTYTKDENGKFIPKLNRAYNENKPTYFEIFDKDLVDTSKLDIQTPIKSYDKNFSNKPLSKSSHNDTVVPYRFEINPDEYDDNVKRLNEFNRKSPAKFDLYSGMGTKFVAQFSDFQLDNKLEGNIDTWNSNFDIAKIHYFLSNADMDNVLSLSPGKNQKELVQDLEYSANEARDYVVTSAQYWTKKTNDILNLHVAQNLKHLDGADSKEVYKEIIKKVNAGVLPEKIKNNVPENVVENILNGSYQLKEQNVEEFKTQVAQYMMDVPLDSIEFGDDISAVFATPYISKRSCREEYLGHAQIYTPDYDEYMTYDRFFLNKMGNPHLQHKYEKVYTETNRLFVDGSNKPNGALSEFAIDIITRLNNDKERPDSQKIFDGVDNTEYGNYVVPYMAEEILKFAVIKSLCPNPRFQVNDNGDISYDYDRLKKITLKDIGVTGITPEDEAEQLVQRVKKGLKNISESDKEALADALKKKFKGTTVESFRCAEAIVDRTQSGLDWRIDAAKDVADIESLRNDGETDFDTVFRQVTNFWDKFAQNVLQENPNAYMVAELTDMNDLHNEFGENSKRYPNKANLIGKFLHDSSLTSVANYDYFFSTLPEIFAKKFNNGDSSQNGGKYLDRLLHEKITDPNYGFLRSAQLSALTTSYTFVNNHDNTRALHAMALDTDLFNGIENHWTGSDNRLKAARLMAGDDSAKISDFDYSRASGKDLAMVEALDNGFNSAIDGMKKDSIINSARADELKFAIKTSLTEIANGQFNGSNFEKDSFGVKPFDQTIELAISNAKTAGLEIQDREANILSERTFETILKPAYQKYTAMMEFLVALPGNPTLYSGDELGSTGYEYETKNVTLQNRSFLHNEWVDRHSPEKRKFVTEMNNNLKKIMYQRKRPELQALNDGAIFPLKLQQGTFNGKSVDVPTLLRENTAGYMTVSLFNVSDAEKAHSHLAELKPNTVTLNHIDLSQEVGEKSINVGLPSGLPLKTVFLDASKDNSDMKDIYVVEKNSENKYCIKHRVKDTDGSYKNAPIEIKDNTMILYHDPKVKGENLAFKGRKFLYNPQFNNFGSYQTNLYNINSKENICGEKLSLVSR